MEGLRRVLRWIDTSSRWQANVFAATCLTLIGVTLADIIGRLLGKYTTQLFDIEWFHLAFLLTLTMSYSLLTRSFVRVDLLSNRYSPRTQRLLMFLGFSLFGIPITVLFAVYAWHFAIDSWAIKELTMSASKIPVYPIKMFIFAGLVLSLPQLIAEAIRHFYFIIKKVEL